MGLLDDAIREHLELKRLRGADPVEVAREQREALDPTLDATQRADGTEDAAPPVDAAGPVEAQDVGVPGHDQEIALAEHHDAGGELADLVQETAELDMRAVMAADAGASVADTSTTPPHQDDAQPDQNDGPTDQDIAPTGEHDDAPREHDDARPEYHHAPLDHDVARPDHVPASEQTDDDSLEWEIPAEHDTHRRE